jgi:hypothetical protein
MGKVKRTHYCQPNCIERVIGHFKINRAIAMRYDQLAETFLGMLFIASARYWMKFAYAYCGSKGNPDGCRGLVVVKF